MHKDHKLINYILRKTMIKMNLDVTYCEDYNQLTQLQKSTNDFVIDFNK